MNPAVIIGIAVMAAVVLAGIYTYHESKQHSAAARQQSARERQAAAARRQARQEAAPGVIGSVQAPSPEAPDPEAADSWPWSETGTGNRLRPSDPGAE